ncbi:hypothetical protein F5888DRAFT_1801592 [Russula emetica]|nr:hypothetical protein F5888DRAFT_1801592 [Russula emetica]
MLRGLISTRPSPSPRNKANNSPTPRAPGTASRSSSVYSRKRASLSSSVLVPDAATKRAAAVSTAVSKPTHVPPHSRSRASTSSESSSESSSSEDVPFASLVQPQCLGSGGREFGHSSYASEPSNPSQLSAETDNVPYPLLPNFVHNARVTSTQVEDQQVFLNLTTKRCPVPHITPTPIRQRRDPPAFTVTPRPTSHASSPSTGTLAALDKAIADTDCKPELRPSVPAMADKSTDNGGNHKRTPRPLCISFEALL